MTATAPVATAVLTVNRALDRAAGERPGAGGGLRFCDRAEREHLLGWPELRRRALAVAGRLAVLGVGRGERVALVFPTGEGFFDAFFGALAAGAVPVPLYPPVRLGRLGEYHRRTAALIAAAGARLVLADRRVRRILGETAALARPALGCLTLDALPQAPPRAELADPEPDELALVQFSSGTTVEPKPVALSHRAVMAQAVILNGFWPDGHPDAPGGLRLSGVSWLPLYHDMGLIGCIFPALERAGAELTLLPPEAFVARPALWLRAVSRHRAAVSPAPNFAYALCLARVRDEELDGVDLSSWRVALNGAEAVAPRVLRAFRDRFARWGLSADALTPVYGLSEAALAVTFSDLGRPFAARRFDRAALAAERAALPAEDGVELPSLGRPLPGFAVAVLPEGGSGSGNGDGATAAPPSALTATPPRPADGLPAEPRAEPPAPPLSEGRVGRVWVAGPSLMTGYLGRPEATAAVLRDGWLDTGDLGFLLGGELYLTGRSKDVVILRGRNHSPEEIEHALGGVPGARPGCAVAASWLPAEEEPADEEPVEEQPVEEQTERLLLFVEAAREAGEAERAALPAACRDAVLAATGLEPDRVLVLEPGTLPRTSSGKLRRHETLRRHLAGELTPPAPVNPLRLAGALARSQLAFARLRLGGADAAAGGDE
jgi:acyl-CoA synthetase (AMP-forming)/AMP-acid ligase II